MKQFGGTIDVDPATLIIGALTAGVAPGLTDAATAAVRDAYEGLRRLLGRLFSGRSVAEIALEQHVKDPDAWRDILAAQLRATEAVNDAEIIAAAENVMNLVDPDGARSGTYVVTVRGSQGVQVGDRNVQTNTFNARQP